MLCNQNTDFTPPNPWISVNPASTLYYLGEKSLRLMRIRMIMMKMMRLKRIVWMMPVCGTRTDADATVNGLVANLTNVVASVGMVFVFMITAQKHVESASKNYFLYN